jgi:hypothetical protein
MVCFSAAPGGADCLASDEQHLGLWVAAPAVAGAGEAGSISAEVEEAGRHIDIDV